MEDSSGSMLRFPYILSKQRSEEGKKIRREYKNDIGVPYNRVKAYLPIKGECFSTVTTFETENLIMESNNNQDMEMTYHPHPTKEDLLEYFGQRIRVRKMHEREALRLMDVDDNDIEKLLNATETVLLKNGSSKTKKAISKTAAYKLAGNSICVSCLYHIFRTLYIQNQPENERIARDIPLPFLV